MKASQFAWNHFSTYKKPLLCEKQLLCSSSSQASQSYPQVFGLLARKKQSFQTIAALVLKEVRAGLVALVLASTANRRIYFGLGLMGVVAPLAACAYLLFDRQGIDKSWYHLNYFHLFFLLSPHIFEAILLCGVFLLFPQGSKRAYLLVVPAGFVFAKILWLIQIDNNNDFWRVVPMSFFLLGILIATLLFLTMDWLTHRQFHRADAFDKRLEGLYNVSDELSNEKIASMFKNVMREKKEFKKQY